MQYISYLHVMTQQLSVLLLSHDGEVVPRREDVPVQPEVPVVATGQKDKDIYNLN